MAISKAAMKCLDDVVTLLMSYGMTKEHIELVLKAVLLVISTELQARAAMPINLTGKETIQ